MLRNLRVEDILIWDGEKETIDLSRFEIRSKDSFKIKEDDLWIADEGLEDFNTSLAANILMDYFLTKPIFDKIDLINNSDRIYNAFNNTYDTVDKLKDIPEIKGMAFDLLSKNGYFKNYYVDSKAQGKNYYKFKVELINTLTEQLQNRLTNVYNKSEVVDKTTITKFMFFVWLHFNYTISDLPSNLIDNIYLGMFKNLNKKK